MNLREMTRPERAVPYRKQDSNDTDSRVPPDWLACYPHFQQVLAHGSTCFGALPFAAKLVAFKRVLGTARDYETVAPQLNDIGAAYVEVTTHGVEAVVRQYLGEQAGANAAQAAELTAQLDELAAQMPAQHRVHEARPPCLVSPGGAVFVDGWMRFFTYRSRGDLTIPLLAVDWPRLVERLQALEAKQA
jgi:hypothetical protein